ncbi:unnamed protein product [Aphanomyces euteiches]
MAKRSRREDETGRRKTRLQDDIMPIIATYIAEPDDFFSFLEAIGPTNLNGPLKSIWNADFEIDRYELWPSLYITNSLSDSQLKSLEDCVSYYSTVRVPETTCLGSLKWLKKHVHRKTQIHWVVYRSSISYPYHEMTNFRVTRLEILLHCTQDVERLAAILPTLLEHLVALILLGGFDKSNLDKILSHVAESKQLTEFECWKMGDHKYNITVRDSMVRNVLKWLSRQPVRVFRIKNWDVSADDYCLKQEFYETIFNCPTIDTLACSHCNLNGVDFTKCLFPMRALQIKRGMDPRMSKVLLSQLVQSKVTHLKWSPDFASHYGDYHSDYFSAMQFFFQTLPTTSIKSLDLSHHRCNYFEWKVLAPLLKSSRIKTLKLRLNTLDSGSADLIAQAIKDNRTISEIDLCSNDFDYEAAMTLIECATDSSRPVRMKSINVGRNCMSEIQYDKLKILAAQHNLQTLKTSEDRGASGDELDEISDDSSDEDIFFFGGNFMDDSTESSDFFDVSNDISHEDD